VYPLNSDLQEGGLAVKMSKKPFHATVPLGVPVNGKEQIQANSTKLQNGHEKWPKFCEKFE